MIATETDAFRRPGGELCSPAPKGGRPFETPDPASDDRAPSPGRTTALSIASFRGSGS
jgi:hypothetical protein